MTGSKTIPAPCARHGFIRGPWFEMLARHCFPDAQIVMLQGSLDGASVTLPMVDDGGHLVALANYYSFAYGPIFDGEPNADQRLALLRQLARKLRATHRRLSFYPLLDEGGVAEEMRRAFASAGWIALLTDQNGNHVIDLNGRDFATYWRQRPGALRSSVKRKARANAYGFAIHSAFDDALWRDYLTVYAASWKNAEPYPAMVRAIAEDATARGALRLGFARATDGQPIAVQLWTIEGSTACIHKIAHDNAFDGGSPGTLLSHHMFRHMIDDEHVQRIDYGTGGNAYKRDWMEEERPMLRLDCFDPRKADMWLPALKTRISQLVRRPT